MAEYNVKEKIQELIKKLKDDDLEIKQQAAWDLHKLAEEGFSEVKLAIPLLKETKENPDWVLRKMSILALGELGVKEEIQSFIFILLNDEHPEVRVGAAEALGKLKAEEAVAALIKALDDNASIVQQVSVYSLGLLKEEAKEAVPKLIEILEKPEDIELVQINNLAAWALGNIKDERAVQPLIDALKRAEYHERRFEIAYSLALIEGLDGIGYKDLLEMKNKYELSEHELELLEKLLES